MSSALSIFFGFSTHLYHQARRTEGKIGARNPRSEEVAGLNSQEDNTPPDAVYRLGMRNRRSPRDEIVVCTKSTTVLRLRAWNCFGVFGQKSIHKRTSQGVGHRERGNIDLHYGPTSRIQRHHTELMYASHPESCICFWLPLHLYNTIRLELCSGFHRLPSELFT